MRPLIENFINTRTTLETLEDDSWFSIEELYCNTSVVLIINEICGTSIKSDFENCMS